MALKVLNPYLGCEDKLRHQGSIINVYDTYAHALAHAATGLATIYAPDRLTGDTNIASLVEQDLTFTAVARGTSGNDITIEYTDGATAGAEVVTVVGNAISIQIDDGVSTATQIKAAFDAESDATDLASCTISGTGSNAQDIIDPTNLEDGRGELVVQEAKVTGIAIDPSSSCMFQIDDGGADCYLMCDGFFGVPRRVKIQ